MHCVAKYRDKLRGDPLVESKKLQKKSNSAEKNRVQNIKGNLCFRGSGRRCSCFERVSGVSSMFRTFVVQVDDIEQMNEKVDRWH